MSTLAAVVIQTGSAGNGRGDETWFFGNVKDKDTEDPIVEAEIMIKKGEHEYTAYTNTEGYYEKQVEGGGEYTLIAEHADYKTEDARAVVETGDEKRVDFQLEKKDEEQETWFVGTVKDNETEDPIVEAEITIKKGEHEYTTFTNGDGAYEKQVEGGGEYTLIAEHADYKTEDARAVVETGDEKRVDFQLEKKEEPKTRFFGHVKDKDTGDPILEAKVTIKKGDTTYTTHTGEGGYYSQHVEGGGEYTLIAEKEGYNTKETHAVIETGDEKRVDFFLEKKEEEQETWFFGHVKDKDTEDPILEAEVTIRKGDTTYTTYTGEGGYYDQQVEEGGEYTLWAEKEGYNTQEKHEVVETGNEKRVDFFLEKKEEEQHTWFVGTVKDKNTEEAIVEAEITIKKGDHTYTAFTNAEGHYEKQVEGGGEYTLIAEHADYKTEDARAVVETGDEKRVDFHLEKKEEERETWFVGRVRDKATEDPIVEAEVTIKKGDHTYTTYTNAEGHYEKQVEGGGEYTLIAEHADYKTEDARAEVETGGEKHVNFLLQKKEEEQETWFVGHVKDKDTEEAIAEAEVTIRKGDHTYTTYTNAEGHYSQQVEGGGEYTLIVEHADYKTTDEHVVIETGDEKRVNFLLEKKEEEKETWFFGTVRDKDTEDPIGGVEITIKKGDQTYTVLTDEEGYYAQEVNGGGEYTLIAEKDGYKTTDASVGVETGDEKQVDFQLESEGGRGMQDVASGGDEPDTFQLQMLAVLFVGLLGTMMLIIYLPSRYFKS